MRKRASVLLGKLKCLSGCHSFFIPKNVDKWKEEMERQIDTVGYVNIYCERCGAFMLRIIPGGSGKEAEDGEEG